MLLEYRHQTVDQYIDVFLLEHERANPCRLEQVLPQVNVKETARLARC
jgi:hypothetical protein